jgi:hypothetical protein
VIQKNCGGPRLKRLKTALKAGTLSPVISIQKGGRIRGRLADGQTRMHIWTRSVTGVSGARPRLGGDDASVGTGAALHGHEQAARW